MSKRMRLRATYQSIASEYRYASKCQPTDGLLLVNVVTKKVKKR
jgi:hypothetical protein